MIENVRRVTSDETQEVIFRFKNDSKEQVKILVDKTEADEEITVVPKHKVLAPGTESEIKITVDGKKMKELNRPDGYFSKRVVIYTDEAEGARKQLSVNGTFERIFSAAEKASAPQIKFETESVDGGKIIEGEKFEFDYVFTNDGKSPLILTSVKPSCGCTTPHWPQGKEIQPGESEKISVSFNSRGRMGKQTKSVTVRSNAVETPTVVLKFTVEVVKDPFHAGGMMGGGSK
jgi:phage baseplate assembly protein gpV